MKKFYRRSISGLLALLICFTTILGSSVTALATSAPAETAKSYSVAFPRNGDANLDTSGTWGHDELHYMNGWTSGEKTWMTTLHTIGDFNGPACYCIEPGVPRLLERTYTRYGEDYWKDYPSECNSTIDADTIKTLLGRIMQYGYQGNLSLGWRSQNNADANKLAHMMATQVLVWETVVGERDANFNHVDPGRADAVKSVYRTSHPLYSRFSAYYDSMEASVKKHTILPSFMARSTGKAQTVEMNWDGSRYTTTLTDTNGVLSDYTFSSEQTGIDFTTRGNTLTITAEAAPTKPLIISATKTNIRKGVAESSHMSSSQRSLAEQKLDFASEYITDGNKLQQYLRPGRLIIVDLRDEFIEKDEALGLFVVMLNVFSSVMKVDGRAFNKFIVFDEAHKYMNNRELVGSITTAIREMRHKGVSVMIASQDPMSLPTEIIELSSIVVMHRFSSPAWVKHVQKAITPLQTLTPTEMASLGSGEAYIWANKATDKAITQRPIKISIRPRVTKHGGDTIQAIK